MEFSWYFVSAIGRMLCLDLFLSQEPLLTQYHSLVYFFIYTVRIKGWTFGFGPLFGLLGKGVDNAKGLFVWKGKGNGKDLESSGSSTA